MNHSQNEAGITDEELDIALGNLVVEPNHTDNDDEEQQQDTEAFDDNDSDDDNDDDDDESYDFYARTLKRLQNRDPSLHTLEICNTMEWGGLDRWRDDGGFLDVAAWFQSLCELLKQAKYSPVENLELTNVLLDYPMLADAVIDLLTTTTTTTICEEEQDHDDTTTTTTTTSSNNCHCRSSWNRLSIDDCMGVEPPILNALHQIELSSLHLANNHMSESALISLGELLTTNLSIHRLRITEHFTAAATEALSTSLVDNTTLHELDFLGSTFFVGDNNSNNNNNNNHDDDDDHNNNNFAIIPELAVGLEANQGIRTLSFSHCHLQDHQLARLVYAVRRHKTLTWLDLSYNHIGANTCDALQALFSSSSFEHHNDDSMSAATADQETSTTKMKIPSSIVANVKGFVSSSSSPLIGLSLVHARIDDEKAIQIVSALAAAAAAAAAAATNQYCFKHLHLCGNNITNTGIQRLAEILPNVSSLETLWVSENDFGDDGSRALLSLVREVDGLTDIVLDRHLLYHDDIQYQVLLNRGGHGALKDSTISLALWPLVFERCDRIKHYCRKAGPADSIYNLLRGPAIFNNPVFQKR